MSVDPGGTSGLAFRMPNNEIIVCKAQTIEEVLEYFTDATKPQQVVLEEWQYFNGRVTPSGFLTANIVASLTGVCYVLKIPLALRTPQSRNSQQRKAEDWIKQHYKLKTILKINSHESDALAHLLAWESLHPELQKQVNKR